MTPPPPVAWRRLLPPVLLVAVVLTAFSNGYGYDRDELYFAMLKPAWGYVDQPPLTPLLAHGLASVYDGGPWLLRIPPTLCGAGCVLVTALIARELGGGAKAQAWTAWGMATTSAVLLFGHVMLTSAPDLVAWGVVSLCVFRAELRDQPRWWLVAGAVAGLATYNKLLVVVLLAGIALGLAIVGPRRRLLSPYVWGGAGLTVLLGLPNIIYQLTHDLPQLRMGRALAENNAGDVRVSMWVLLIVLLGPPLVVIWAMGLRALWRDRRVRFVVVVFVVVVLFTFVSGAQPHYPVFILPIPFAAGIVAMQQHLGRVWAALFAVNGAVSLVLGLPLIPVGSVGATPVPDVNLLAQDSIGWPVYVDQITAPYDALPDRTHAVVVTSNYGEAGAVHHYRPDVPVYSAQNALYDQARPSDDTAQVVFVGGEYGLARSLFTCRVVDRLDNGVDVDNEEQGEPVAVCTDPRMPWPELWDRLHHLD
ncbi:MAG TPA: glycosyltransferase family 39 protein [Nocardioides sp.]|jgi:4-amino-4-deoxy-L-arabinose transferase-like glycosyltransferase|nr:glycosyltransferase family 39 protein [Nocardioides sp.]